MLREGVCVRAPTPSATSRTVLPGEGWRPWDVANMYCSGRLGSYQGTELESVKDVDRALPCRGRTIISPPLGGELTIISNSVKISRSPSETPQLIGRVRVSVSSRVRVEC